MKEFEDFIQSPYLKGSRDYATMLSTIYSFNKNQINLESISNEDFFRRIYPGKKYNNKTLRNRLTEITVFAKKFLIQKTLEKDNSLKDYLLLKGLKEKKLYSIFKSELVKTYEDIKTNSKRSSNVSEIMVMDALVLMESGEVVKAYNAYKKYTEYYTSYFLESLFEMMLEYESEKTYDINVGNNIVLDLVNNLRADKFIQTLENKNDNNCLYIILFYYLYKSFLNLNDEIIYKKFSKIFFHNLEKISSERKNDFFGLMISRYFMKINMGDVNLFKEVFKLYNIKLKLGLHSELNEIRYPSTAFRDYIIVGLRMEKFKWVEDFIIKYSTELPVEIRNNEVNMAYTRLHLIRKEYDKALEYLNKMKTTNYIYILDASRIRLRIYYDNSDFENAFLEIDRIKHYFRNNNKKIALSVRKYSKEFLDKYIILLRLKLNPDKQEIEYFLKSVQECPGLILKVWLIEKVKEMRVSI